MPFTLWMITILQLFLNSDPGQYVPDRDDEKFVDRAYSCGQVIVDELITDDVYFEN